MPSVDTPLSPPPEDKGPNYNFKTSSCFFTSDAAPIDAMANHFNGTVLAENTRLSNYTDCVVCGKSVSQIQSEAVNDYLDKTVVLGETLAETEARRRAFLDWMSAGTFLLMPGGVSQAPASEGITYTFAYSYYKPLPGTIPLK